MSKNIKIIGKIVNKGSSTSKLLFLMSHISKVYHWAKYKFYLNPKYEKFCLHSEFETYIVNKIDRMISMRALQDRSRK